MNGSSCLFTVLKLLQLPENLTDDRSHCHPPVGYPRPKSTHKFSPPKRDTLTLVMCHDVTKCNCIASANRPKYGRGSGLFKCREAYNIFTSQLRL